MFFLRSINEVLFRSFFFSVPSSKCRLKFHWHPLSSVCTRRSFAAPCQCGGGCGEGYGSGLVSKWQGGFGWRLLGHVRGFGIDVWWVWGRLSVVDDDGSRVVVILCASPEGLSSSSSSSLFTLT
ncbi:hypothetical protein RJT34_08760 [Clitoria ternatea]|uniref:Uncharacterized protein n=1 Tax=Clitoria ternatea TaxID=43366 RepID=A0AAN9K708_CLITE